MIEEEDLERWNLEGLFDGDGPYGIFSIRVDRESAMDRAYVRDAFRAEIRVNPL